MTQFGMLYLPHHPKGRFGFFSANHTRHNFACIKTNSNFPRGLVFKRSGLEFDLMPNLSHFILILQLKQKLTKMSRNLVIGDIHGGLRGLTQTLDLAEVTPQDHLIFVGDYIDGWSESAQVIQFLLNLNKEIQCTFLKGNHDVWCHDWLAKGQLDSTWYKHGGKETIKSYDNINRQEKEDHIAFFENLQNYFVDDQNRLFVHAGFTSLEGPAKEEHPSVLYWDRTLWEMAIDCNHLSTTDPFYSERLQLFHEIYIGHTPTTKRNVFVPWKQSNVWNTDTGAAFKGRLSILDIDSKEFWQSDQLCTLYPSENGRNK
jgi:serine/threonine protein phosphatase 1